MQEAGLEQGWIPPFRFSKQCSTSIFLFLLLDRALETFDTSIMASRPPFVLSRATPSDMENIVNLQYDCFDDVIRQIFMGVKSKEDLPKVRDDYVKKMQSDPNDVWIQVVNKESGQVVAASNWKVYVNGETHGGVKEQPPEGIEGETLERSKDIMAKMNEKRAKSMPGPFVRKLFGSL